MKIIAGLGNPGRKYAANRHNIGALIAGEISRHFSVLLKDDVFSSITGKGKINGESVLIILPQTYMNNSGIAIKAALDYYREDPGSLVVIHDEIELPFGDYRYKFGGGHKGHNGIRSIIQHTGTPDFHRIRVGVSRPRDGERAVADHVLSDFTQEELDRFYTMRSPIIEFITNLFFKGEGVE